MSSPIRSSLARLDESLQTLKSQLDCMQASLEISDTQLGTALADATQSAAIVRDLILAEDPGAQWNDRHSLEIVIQDLEYAAIERLKQQRRARLLGLANELEAGTVHHRFESRSAVLNGMRMEAVGELRKNAALAEQEKELPGPEPSAWMYWACNLQEGSGAVFDGLHRDFPALERFVSEMEERYWRPIPRGSAPPPSAPPPTANVYSTPVRTPPTPAPPSVERYTPPPASNATAASSAPAVEAPPEPQAKASDSETDFVAVETPAENSASEGETASSERTEHAFTTFGNVANGDKKKPIAVYAAGAGIVVVLAAVFLGIHGVNATTSTKPVATAPAKAADAPAAAPATPVVHQPVEGTQHQILLNLESCERAGASIECRGSVSNTGTDTYRVALGAVVVVDGKGNSFNLNGGGQFNFSAGRNLSLAGGAHVPYTVTIPDKDGSARSLTLYLDLNSPRGLEYTFRDIPITDQQAASHPAA